MEDSGIDQMQELYNLKAYQGATQGGIERTIHRDERKRFEWFWNHSALDKLNSSFFEVGPGSGVFFHQLLEKGAGNYRACDINVNTIAQFEQFFPGESGRIAKLDARSAFRQEQKDSLDCIVCMNVIEHFSADYLAETISLMTERLRIGGELWIYTPCAESVVAMQNRYYDLTHRWSFVLHNFQALGNMHDLRLVAKSGKIIAVKDPNDAIRWLHEKFLYWLNRFLFAFTIGTRAENGVFSAEICVILKKRG